MKKLFGILCTAAMAGCLLFAQAPAPSSTPKPIIERHSQNTTKPIIERHPKQAKKNPGHAPASSNSAAKQKAAKKK